MNFEPKTPLEKLVLGLGLAMENAGKNPVVVILFIALVLIVPVTLVYNYTINSWNNIIGVSRQTENRLFEPPPSLPADSESTPLAEANPKPPLETVDNTLPVTEAGDMAKTDERLQHIIDAWPHVPENLRQAMDNIAQPYRPE